MQKGKDSFMEVSRRKAFFFLDRLRGGEIRKMIREDQRAYKHGTSVKQTEEKIKALLKHAHDTTAFYKNYNPEDGLASYPVVSKQVYLAQYDDFFSLPYKNRKDNRSKTTSGSTGVPFTIIQDHRKIQSNRADGIFLGEMANYYIGQRQAFVRVWTNYYNKSPLAMFLANSIKVESASLSDDNVKEIVHTLRSKKIRNMTGYPSGFGQISRYLEKNGQDMRDSLVSSIIPIAEYISPIMRRKLADQFGCTVRSWYSNEECGIMGVQDRDQSERYYINLENYYYEFLKLDSDEPAEEGELGRIVITDLMNYAFPIIRYDTGDTAKAKRLVRNGREKLYITELYGRRLDLLYDTKGEPVSPFIINNNMEEFEGVNQYRFVQTAVKEYELYLVGDAERMNTEEMERTLKQYLGSDARLKINHVEHIQSIKSGKMRYIENLVPEYAAKS